MLLVLSEITCDTSGILEVLYIVKTVLKIVTVFAPILLVIMSMINIVTITTGEDPSPKRVMKKVIPKLLSATFIFLLPSIINLVMDITGGLKLTNDQCWQEATRENVELKKEEEKNSLTKLEEERTNKLNSDVQQELEKAKKTTLNTKTEDDEDVVYGDPIVGTYDIKNKSNLVAIMYSTWFDKILPSNPQLTFSEKCYVGNYCFWGEPAIGFYKSSDKSVIKKHMRQLEEAGIDFIILDNTNMNPDNNFKKGNSEWEGYVTTPMTALLDTIVEMRANGEETPYVVNWIYTGNVPTSKGVVPFTTWETVNSIYDQFYTKEKYKDVWVYWDEKPFIITTSTPTSSAQRSITTRSMWGLNGVSSSIDWSYLEKNNDQPGKGADGSIEQIGVSVAMQATYMSDPESATGRNKGKTFYNQWKTAFNYHPKIVTITWWNEWGAINLQGKFTDLYSTEYSRDIEPMSGGHGDTYYQWMKKYIKAYKNNESCPSDLHT